MCHPGDRKGWLCPVGDHLTLVVIPATDSSLSGNSWRHLGTFWLWACGQRKLLLAAAEQRPQKWLLILPKPGGTAPVWVQS